MTYPQLFGKKTTENDKYDNLTIWIRGIVGTLKVRYGVVSIYFNGSTHVVLVETTYIYDVFQETVEMNHCKPRPGSAFFASCKLAWHSFPVC